VKNWLNRLWLFFNNRVAEPIHAHIRRVLNVPSWQELEHKKQSILFAESEFLKHVEEAESRLAERENRVSVLLAQADNAVWEARRTVERLQGIESSVKRLYSEAEHVASEVTVAASDATVQLSQIIRLLRQVQEYEKKKAKEYEAGRGNTDRSDAKDAARGSNTNNDGDPQ